MKGFYGWWRKEHKSEVLGLNPGHLILGLPFSVFLFFFFLIILFLAVLGLRFCARAPSSRGKPFLNVVRGPLTVAASLVAEHRLQTRRLSSCGSRA